MRRLMEPRTTFELDNWQRSFLFYAIQIAERLWMAEKEGSVETPSQFTFPMSFQCFQPWVCPYIHLCRYGDNEGIVNTEFEVVDSVRYNDE